MMNVNALASVVKDKKSNTHATTMNQDIEQHELFKIKITVYKRNISIDLTLSPLQVVCNNFSADNKCGVQINEHGIDDMNLISHFIIAPSQMCRCALEL